MKKKIFAAVLAAGLVMGAVVSCGRAGDTAPSEDTSQVSGGLDNFDADQDGVKAFAEEIQAIVAQKDLEKLAERMVFPNYVSVYEPNGGVVNTREEFIAIGEETVFPKEMTDSIAAADIDGLDASMAGFVLVSKEDSAAPSITFGMADGELKITGINY